jgi:hypothetical protein
MSIACFAVLVSAKVQQRGGVAAEAGEAHGAMADGTAYGSAA